MAILKLSGGDLGRETMLVRCNLTEASSPIEVDYQNEPGEHWTGTQFQCADCLHRIGGVGGLADRGKFLAAYAVNENPDDFDCDVEEMGS
jgi:hypothetical protein